uniref:Uncharacterized protein AlNc14C271G9967 n=1 Tax=Albugo laibachii Nc14 TaxID=890382 RepID=F0WUE7_9STRA|nr:conserved hypothetical protein [Albugo laibachii Nc14]|eukprot:CCA25027.1 conserved hypothetical protein [Albugo laibachii Nc14]
MMRWMLRDFHPIKSNLLKRRISTAPEPKNWDRLLANEPEKHGLTKSDILYENPRKAYFGFASAGSLANIAFWSWLKGYEESLVEMIPTMEQPNFYSWIMDDIGSTLGFGSGIILAFMVGFHARRSVAKISIISGGKKLRITTHRFLGSYSPPFDVPAGQISANPNTTKNMIMKIGTRMGFYLADSRGKFYNRDKLESMINFTTDFSAHAKMKSDVEKRSKEIHTLPKTELRIPDSEGSSSIILPRKIAITSKKLKRRKPSKRLGELLQMATQKSEEAETKRK